MGLYRSIIGNKLRIAQLRNVQNRKLLGWLTTKKKILYDVTSKSKYVDILTMNMMWLTCTGDKCD